MGYSIGVRSAQSVYRNESFAFSAAPGTQPKMFIWVFDHKTLGKDKQLGQAEVDVSAWCPV